MSCIRRLLVGGAVASALALVPLAVAGDKKDVDAALEEMIDSDRPFVLDVMVPYQEHVLPMIPSGMTVRDIIKA